MVGDVAATPRLVHLDTARRENLRPCKDVRSATIATNAEREDMRMLDQEQEITNGTRAALFDQRTLNRERLRVRYQAEPADAW
jgi:hypothetical protein